MKIITRELDFSPEYDLSYIADPETILFFDIETTGLKKETTQLYLIGAAWLENGKWRERQWLTENAADELLILEDFLDFASDFEVLMHFNGDNFDIPYINYKADYYSLENDLSRYRSVDIYRHAKKARKFLQLQSMSQKGIEEYLGIFRDDQLNGGLLIPVYYDYERSGSKDLEELLLLHNFDDIQGMLKILPIMSYADALTGGYRFCDAEECQKTWILHYQLDHKVPKSHERFINKDDEDIQVCMEGDMLEVNIRIREGVGFFPLTPVKDYYYLIEEDKVIHKDIAQFVDKHKKKRATKDNCFVKKDGRFLPVVNYAELPWFYLTREKKQTYVEFNDELKLNEIKVSGIVQGILNRISSC